MHLFRPPAPYFAGDCMPFFHDGVFHLFYLLDENHHQGLGGLGGHQWAHASTRDLHIWQQHPLALAIEQDWEASICTGSVFWHAGAYYAFYATRRPDWTQQLSFAAGIDGVQFSKQEPNPFFVPPAGYGRFDFRDPFVFQDEAGRFQMLLTARLEPFALNERGGCLLRLSSPDLRTWTAHEPFLIPGGEAGRSVPECADYFAWNGWYYLIYSLGLRTYYRMARQPFGPWQKPMVDLLDSPLNWVIKTAPFGVQRRICAGTLGTRERDKDDGRIQWGGDIVLRELVQNDDGTLGTRFVPETLPSGARVHPRFCALTAGAEGGGAEVRLQADQTQEVAALDSLPDDFYLHCQVSGFSSSTRFGLGLRGSGVFANFIELGCEPGLGKATLAEQRLEGVRFIDRPFELQVRVCGDVVETCLGGRRCLINRLPERREGERLFLFCEHGQVVFEQIEIFPEINLSGQVL